ncbi:MAG: response regulator [Polyangiaceae bacterium]|jgi:DNA-binding response OmpR family regulator|nr:response regulator [Polyangiaceae bacterium]
MKATPGAARGAGAGAKVLVIDDDATFGRLIQRRLSNSGYAADYRDCPFGATTEIARGAYALVVLDVNMPGLSGPGLVEALRYGRRPVTAKVLLMSSADDDVLRRIAEHCQADGFVGKGAAWSEVLSCVRAILAK